MARKQKRRKNNGKTNSRKTPRSNKNGTISKKKKSVKKKKRDLTNLPGLKKNLFSRKKQEYHDIDYADQLNDKEREWLSRFMEEDLGARLNHPGKKIYKKKQDKLEVWRRNNQRERDLYSLLKATGKINGQEPTTEYLESIQNRDTTNPEDSIIEAIDSLKKLRKNS